MKSAIIVSAMVEKNGKYKSGAPKAGDDIAELKWVTKKDCKKLKVASPTKELFKFLGWI